MSSEIGCFDSFSKAFGFRTHREELYWNTTIAGSWIPFIGACFSGLPHVEWGVNDSNYILVGRGVVELLGGGPLFFVPDLIITLGRCRYGGDYHESELEISESEISSYSLSKIEIIT